MEKGPSPCVFLCHVASPAVALPTVASAPPEGPLSLSPCCPAENLGSDSTTLSFRCACKGWHQFLALLIPGFVTVSYFTPELTPPPPAPGPVCRIPRIEFSRLEIASVVPVSWEILPSLLDVFHILLLSVTWLQTPHCP